MSMAETAEADRTLEIGDWFIPLSSGEVVQHRRGDPFWPLLTEARACGASILRMPANFPPMGEGATRFRISAMGRPTDARHPGNVHGSSRTTPAAKRASVSGGRIVRVPAFAITPSW